jgi:hypothetical protein
MSEEQESTGKSFKGIIITLVSTVTLGIGGFITNKLTGGDDDKKDVPAAAAPVINITNSNQQSQAAGGKTVVIKEPAKPAPVKKKDGDEFKEEAPKW